MSTIKHIIKTNPALMEYSFKIASLGLKTLGLIIPIKKKRMIFVSLGGRNYDDSPRELYEYLINRREFSDWEMIWALTNSKHYEIPKARIIEFGTLNYWILLLSSRVWIGNGGIDMGLDIVRSKSIIVNTWHGTPIKKIQGEENSNQVLKNYRSNKPIDRFTVRCCQSDYDKEIFARVFHADKNCFVMSGLPRNDKLLKYTNADITQIKQRLCISQEKKVILYMPTYREYQVNSNDEVFLEPPMNLEKWESKLSQDYVLLVRAHYAVTKSMDISNNEFVKDVSLYAPLSDLYAVSDILISDYSSAFFDYAIYGRPLRCFAYEQERGFYMDLKRELPCKVYENEDDLIESIINIDYQKDSLATMKFAQKYIPNEGMACKAVAEEIIKRLND